MGSGCSCVRNAQTAPCGDDGLLPSSSPPSSSTSAAAAAPAERPPRPPSRAPPSDVALALTAARQELAASDPLAFAAAYSLGRVVGRGAFSSVHECIELASGRLLAAKVVPKGVEDLDKQREAVAREVAIMRVLAGHPNVVTLHSAHELTQSFVLVMELCSGGELFDRIVAKGHFSEREAARHMRALLEVVAYAHARCVVHRDLKPENMLLADASPGAPLKIIDFGTSEFCRPGQTLTQRFGTPFYVAPEVLSRQYGVAADVWSCGVILYILLCGFPPFAGRSDARILAKVEAGLYTFAAPEWESVTEDAKDMVARMLVLEPKRRATARQLLEHRWFQTAEAAPEDALGETLVGRLRQFAGMSHLKRLALVALGRTLAERDAAKLRELFLSLDTDHDGHISADDLRSALHEAGTEVDAAAVAQMCGAGGPLSSGADGVDCEEFVAAMVDRARLARKEKAVRRSFASLDRDGDGFITVQDLAQVLESDAGHRLARSCKGPGARRKSLDLATMMMREEDGGCQGRICYQDYLALLRREA